MTGTIHREWKTISRPGYFGRRRDEKIAALNEEYGKENWRLVWLLPGRDSAFEFEEACKLHYEMSYLAWLKQHPDIVDRICDFKECYDNAVTNVQSGLDYTKQESFSTHIQDIAVRNCLKKLGRRFEGNKSDLLQIRGIDSPGYKLGLGPGQIPFYEPQWIFQPSLRPRWAGEGSVEDMWQSNKHIQVYVIGADAHRIAQEAAFATKP